LSRKIMRGKLMVLTVPYLAVTHKTILASIRKIVRGKIDDVDRAILARIRMMVQILNCL